MIDGGGGEKGCIEMRSPDIKEDDKRAKWDAERKKDAKREEEERQKEEGWTAGRHAHVLGVYACSGRIQQYDLYRAEFSIMAVEQMRGSLIEARDAAGADETD